MSITWVPFTGGAFFLGNFGGGGHTWINLNGGTNFPSGSKPVIFLGRDSGDLGGNAWNTPTCGGNNMSRAVGDVLNANSSTMEVWYIDLAVSTADSITLGNAGIPKWASLVGGYLTGAAAGTATNTAEAKYGTLDHTGPGINLAVTVPSSGIGLWGFLANGAAIGTGLTPVWTNTAASASDEYITQNSLAPDADVACNHATASGSVDAIVAPTTGSGYDFICGMIVAAWSVAVATGDNLVGEMPVIQMKRKSLGWTPPLIDHRHRQWRRNRSLLIPSNRLWTPKRKLAA